MPGDSTNTTLNPDKLRAARDSIAAAERKIITLKGGQPGENRTHRFDKERVVLGSVVSADVRLSGDGVAPIHAVLELTPEPVIYDLASESGVFVNGAKVVTHPLKAGDSVTIGRHVLKFSLEDRNQAASQVSKDRVRESGDRKLFLNPDEDFKPLLLEEGAEIEPIFDYRPASRPALEVVMSWHGTILDIEHFVEQPTVTVGATRRCDFGVPPLLGASEFPLVTRAGGDHALSIDPKMKGVIHSQGQLRTLDEVRASASGGPTGHSVPLGHDDFAKISVGEVDFYLSFTQAPPLLKRSRLFEKDPLFFKIFGSSLLLTAVTIFGLVNLRVVPNLDAEQIPERIATILYQPEKYTPMIRKPEPKPQPPKSEATPPPPKQPDPPKPPKPKPTTKVEIQPSKKNLDKPIPKEMDVGKSAAKPQAAKQPAPQKGQSAAKEGEGARHKGAEGSRGTRNASPSKTPQNQASIPDPRGGKGRGSSNSQAQDIGNVDFLKGVSGKIENILSGAGAQLGKGGDTLKGLGGFDTRGNGGAGLSGGGKGGGGTSDFAGLGNRGRGFGKVGTGLGAAGTGHGILGGQARVALRTGGSEETVVMGSIDADAIEAALLAHKDEFRLCYEREINAEHPALAGRVGTTFVIGSSGAVNEAGIESSTLGNANVERCIVGVIKRIRFPMPRGGGVVQVSYPFKYSPVGK